MSQEVLLTVMNSMSLFGESVNMDGKRKETCNLAFELLKSQNAFNDLLKQFFAYNDLKAQLQDKDSTICKLKDMIKSMREKSKDKNVKYDYCEIETKNVFKEEFDSIKRILVCSKELSDSLIDKLNLKSAENKDLKAQIQDKILEPLAPRLLQNREAQIDYLNYTQEQADILREIVEQAKAEHPLDKELDFSCKHAQRIQELLVYVQDTCPNAITLSAKKVVVTPKNKVKKVRFAKHLTSSSNSKHVESSKTSDSNTPVLTSTGLKCSTSKCGSKPTSNKRNDKISQTPSRNMKNKVEVQPRKVNKKNCVVIQIVLWYLDSGCSKHMTGNRSQLMNFVSICQGIVRFGNDHIVRIVGYGDCQLGNLTISRVYYVEGLGHNLFSVGQFCDGDLKVAFRKNNYFIRNLEGVDLLSGSRDTNLYTISLDDMLKTYPICLLSKASKTKSWLWHCRLSHLNFGTINKLAKDGLTRGIPRLKFQKDHLCFAYALGKSKKSSHQPKAKDTNQEKLYLLHMDLCGLMCMASINGKRYILVIVDDYSRFTWVRFLRTKDEAPEAIIKCIKIIQVCLNATVCNVRIDNGTEFVNQTLREFYENVRISHQTSVARTPQ
ncbi:retrovirus-related pol polyprotein from transposon TNT 1-94 [Tanacetum coccineum]